MKTSMRFFMVVSIVSISAINFASKDVDVIPGQGYYASIHRDNPAKANELIDRLGSLSEAYGVPVEDLVKRLKVYGYNDETKKNIEDHLDAFVDAMPDRTKADQLYGLISTIIYSQFYRN